jgi:putative methylase
MQRRLVRKQDLEKALFKVEPFPKPKIYLEQYAISPTVAADLLYLAAYTYDDIIGKKVADLGCGTGRLAIGSVLLGSKEAVGVDIERGAIKKATQNANRLKVNDKVHWLLGDLSSISGTFDTVLQNPPFGVQRKKADQVFLKKALEIGDRIYSIHNSSKKDHRPSTRSKLSVHQPIATSPSPFLKKFIHQHGGVIKGVYTLQMEIPRMFRFHKRIRHRYPIDLYIIERRDSV